MPLAPCRFDLSSGSTFDLWADDVWLRAVRIIDGEVWVAAKPASRDEATHWRARLGDGLTHNISLVIGKAVLGARAAELIALLGHALLREDAGFHMLQNLQAAVCQYLAWQGDAEAAPILIAAARYLAAHSPTPRAHLQTADVARRLMRGGSVHEDAAELGC